MKLHQRLLAQITPAATITPSKRSASTGLATLAFAPRANAARRHQRLTKHHRSGRTNASCKECPNGRSSEGSSSSCGACEAGTFAPAISNECYKCPAGQYSGRTNACCKECPSGRSSEGVCIVLQRMRSWLFCTSGSHRVLQVSCWTVFWTYECVLQRMPQWPFIWGIFIVLRRM